MFSVLIETSWNVKNGADYTCRSLGAVLIETSWNVKTAKATYTISPTLY